MTVHNVWRSFIKSRCYSRADIITAVGGKIFLHKIFEIVCYIYSYDIVGIIALHTLNKADAEAARQERILAVSFVATAPAGIAEDVDVGGPDGQALENVAVTYIS